MSIIKHVTLQKIVAHDFRYDPRTLTWSTFCYVPTVQTVVFFREIKNIYIYIYIYIYIEASYEVSAIPRISVVADKTIAAVAGCPGGCTLAPR